MPIYFSSCAQNLIKSILQSNADKRPSFKKILANQWLGCNKVNQCKINYHDVDSDILDFMEVSFDKNQVISDLAKNRHNSATATYYILLKKKAYKEEFIPLKNGSQCFFYDSVSDKTFLDVRNSSINSNKFLYFREKHANPSTPLKPLHSFIRQIASPRCHTHFNIIESTRYDNKREQKSSMSMVTENTENNNLIEHPTHKQSPSTIKKIEKCNYSALRANCMLNSLICSDHALKNYSIDEFMSIYDGPFELEHTSLKDPNEIMKTLIRVLVRVNIKHSNKGPYKVICIKVQFKFEIEVVSLAQFAHLYLLQFRCLEGGDSEEIRFIQQQVFKMLVL